jgi:hypothetical protein
MAISGIMTVRSAARVFKSSRTSRRPPDSLAVRSIFMHMPRGIIALVFRCKITGGQLKTNSEVSDFQWADESTVRELTSEAYAVRLLDALRQETTPAIRQHDGTQLID